LTVVTLTTDFGLKDGNVGVMKGVIWRYAPHAQIADLSHLIGPQNIREAALVLARAVPYFPPDSVHVVVVDPGVGTERRPIAAQIGSQKFVAPDNGVLSMVLDRAEQEKQRGEIVHLTKPQYWLPSISNVFHGRDIFAPVAGHLAAGAPLVVLGTPINDPVRLELPKPVPVENGLRGEVLHIDHFGNITTTIRQEHLNGKQQVTVRLGGYEIRGLVRTFGDRPPGSLIALIGSSGDLIVSVVNGSAAGQLNVKIGDPVDVQYEPQQAN